MQLVHFDERVRQAQLARQFGNANAMPFSEWLRRNAPHAMRTGPSAAAPEEEEALLRRRGVRRVGRYRYDFVFSVCITASLAGLALLVFSAMAALYARVDSAMLRMEAAVAPHAATILNSTLEMLSDSRDTMYHLHNTMEHGDIVDTGRNQKRHARFLQISLSRQKPCGHAQDSPVKLGVSHLLIALNQGNVVR